MAMTGPLLNTSSEIGIILEYLTYNVTGSIFLSILAFMVVIIALALAFRIPDEWTALFVFPLIIVMVAMNAGILPIMGIVIIYAAVLLGKNFLYK